MHDLARADQDRCGLVEILQRAQSRFPIGLDGVAEQAAQQSLQHFQRIILGTRFQTMHEGDQRG